LSSSHRIRRHRWSAGQGFVLNRRGRLVKSDEREGGESQVEDRWKKWGD
jgi:hypothetical protein